jgi:hypothetical protein
VPIDKKINKNFFKKWTHEMAYVLGFFAADGYITVNKRGGQFWSIQITDKKLLEEIRRVIESEHTIGVRLGKGKEKTLYRLQIGSVEMCNDLRALGYNERKTKSLALPNVPKKFLSDFVRGYFDGDGNVWAGNMHKGRGTITYSILVGFTSCSDVFLKKLQEVLIPVLGPTNSLFKIRNKDCWCLRYSVNGSLKLYDFMYNGSVVKSNLYLNRKKVVFEKYMKMRS